MKRTLEKAIHSQPGIELSKLLLHSEFVYYCLEMHSELSFPLRKPYKLPSLFSFIACSGGNDSSSPFLALIFPFEDIDATLRFEDFHVTLLFAGFTFAFKVETYPTVTDSFFFDLGGV